MIRRILLSFVACLPLGSAVAETADRFAERRDSWLMDVQIGSLWRASNNTFLDYHVVPTALSVRSPGHLCYDFENGTHFLVRHRISFLAEAFAEGPESYYLGLSASPSVEWWMTDSTYLHFSAGGGFGLVDSQGVPGGQGQDFTYNWFMDLGVRHYVAENFSIGVGAWFQHLSNRGATDPNPGLDAVGPMLSFSWGF